MHHAGVGNFGHRRKPVALEADRRHGHSSVGQFCSETENAWG